MGQLAQRLESAGGGIALQRMHDAAHTTNDLFIRGLRLDFEARLVERLQELGRAFEEERAKLC